jgi:hypothetical protein
VPRSAGLGYTDPMRTRVIDLAEGQDRAGAGNLRTMAMVGARPPRSRPLALLATQWPAIHAVLSTSRDPGVAVVAIDAARDRVAGSMWVAAKPGTINVAVVGRHGQCDLYLESDPAMSLRHLVVIVEPARDWGGPGSEEVRYRLIDLRTGTAFVDEAGRSLEAVTALGPAFVWVGRYLLLCFPTGGEDWPAEVSAAMALLPERVYVDDRDAEPDRWARARRPAAAVSLGGPRAASRSVITAVDGPTRARVDAGDSAERLGTLELSSALGRDTIDVGPEAARRGLLLGRYHRCDSGGATSLALERISRVHALVIEAVDRLWLIDAASTNGMTVDGRGVRVHALGEREAVELGGVGTVRWKRAHDGAF